MEQAIQMTAKGIKCDNPKCDYIDMEIPFEDYKYWVNKPCPKCGENLLTQKCYYKLKLINKLANFINKMYSTSISEKDGKIATLIIQDDIMEINIDD